MKMKNLLIGGMSLALVACISVGGTLAYLSDNTGTMKNTFKMGAGYVDEGLILDETACVKDEDGKVIANPEEISKDNRTEEGNTYLPMNVGDAIAKDPTLTLTAGSVDSYVFIRVEGVDALDAQNLYISDETAAAVKTKDQNTDYAAKEVKSAFNSNWKKVAELTAGAKLDESKLDGYYYYSNSNDNIVKASDQMSPLFKSVLLPNDLTAMPTLTTDSINIMGAAVQADNVADVNAAWELAKGISDFAPKAANP